MEASVQMNAMLKSLNAGSNLSRKNLVAAIAASKSPGNFPYYAPTEEIRNIESNKSLNVLARRVAKVHNELVAIDNEICLATAAAQKRPSLEEQSPGTLAQWKQKYANEFDSVLYKKYDVKAANTQGAMVSTFKPSSKIYGGTAHHKSFKTTSTQLIKGRCTR